AFMSFIDPLFLFVFFPLLYAACLTENTRIGAKKWTLLVASVLFYWWGEPLFVPVLLLTSVLDYYLSLKIHGSDVERDRKVYVAIGVVANLALLCFYKYADFIVANVNAALAPLATHRIDLLQIALPIGVSFVVFERITYLVDTYRRTSEPAPSFWDYGLFVFFFPKLLAGPILKFHEMRAQITAPPVIVWSDFAGGLLRFSRGLAKKLLIADPVGTFADTVFGADPSNLSMQSAWLGLICFALQIFFDFSGYSDMAIGLARMLGFRLRENFNAPYTARSITDFWRRWHISLTTWIRDYLYVPLGGNRGGAWRTYFNLWICFLASGLWHGASWNFVLWGAYNGLFLMLDRLFLAWVLERLGAVLSTAITLVIVLFGWAIFRCGTLEHIGGLIVTLTDFSRTGTSLIMPADVPALMIVGIACCLVPALPAWHRLELRYDASTWLRTGTAAVLLSFYVLSVARASAVPFKPFIYFRF
ncbi:MAG TPA: MBOAT family O-acyltransferase, partial [Burkholderiales bacterium]|nr:MBOAT family O-acyltransferase [Burkholderiales bacterium]